jgi:elongation factor Ts
MAEITAAAVKSLRDRTGLSMMDCKRALQAAGGNEEAAIEVLRKEGAKTQETRMGRETSAGRIPVYTDGQKAGAMVELKCESAPVSNSPEFRQLADDLCKQLATGKGATTADELLAQPSPSKSGMTLKEQRDDLFNRIREVINVGRILRIDGQCAVYAHQAGINTFSVVMEYSGGNAEAAKDVCLHIASMRPKSLTKEELDPTLIAKEREILAEAARKEGKPENIIAKMVDGRMRNFFAEFVLLEQPFVKAPEQTVGKYAEANKLQVKRFVLWELGKE